MTSSFRISLIVLFLFYDLIAFGQNQGTTATTKRADIAITALSLVEATKNSQTGLHKVKVSMTVKNSGEVAAVVTKAKLMIQNPGIAQVVSGGTTTNPWRQLGNLQTVNSILPGQSLTFELVFIETTKVTTGDRFTAGVMVDAGNILKEINENDNNSNRIDVIPVVITEYVALPNTINTTQQLAKVDTFQYVIGRADFQIKANGQVASPDIFRTYIQTSPQGITLRRLGADNREPINASLVAPLHLPAGSAIKKIVFNYILLPQSQSVPHLVLRGQHLNDKGEGYGLNHAITSYWSTSNELNGAGGYQVKNTVWNKGDIGRIAKNGSYHFEILAGDARSTITPQTSLWPDNDKIFIWNIIVHYTLN